jgi:hypothetical protein
MPVYSHLIDPATLTFRSIWTCRDTDSIDGADNDAVAAWNDLSGNDLHMVQATTGSKPVFKTNQTPAGGPAVYFAGSPRFLSCPAWFTDTTNAALTLFIVYKTTASPVYGLMGANRRSGV